MAAVTHIFCLGSAAINSPSDLFKNTAIVFTGTFNFSARVLRLTYVKEPLHNSISAYGLVIREAFWLRQVRYSARQQRRCLK